ncbi:MAG TPA: choice-of-anchor J domain-containing protein, partial [Bacteroidales bacterium]|nr:choice-of-anchor J domain-containing protein [Bacteroidales bacterium]
MKTSVPFGAMRLSLSLFMVLILALGQANAQVDIRESFEDAVFPPSGWTETGSGSWMRVSAASGYPSNTGGFSAYCNGAGSYLITKPALVNPLDILSFWYRAESPAHPQNLDVLIGTNPALLTDTLYRISNNTNYAYTLVEVPLAAYTGQVVYIAFIGQTGAGAIFDYGILLDDVKVYGLPDCATLSSPANGAVNAPVTAVLGWNAALEAAGYRVYLGTNNPPDNILNGVDMGTALSHAPVLNYSTTYYWRVEPYNAIGAATCAVWSFTTGADPVIHAFPWTEEFSIWPPAGWDLSGGARNWAPYGGTAAYCNFWNWPSGTAVMTTPMLDLSTDGMLKFKWSHLPFPSANDKLEVAITESGSGVWSVLWEKSGNDLNSNDGATSLMPGTYKQETISIPVAYTGKTIQIRFSGTSGNGNNLFLDQVMVEFDPFLSVTAESINLCFGETGTLEAVARGGQKPYVYSWTPATGLGQPSAAITSAAPASTTTYNVVVTDALGSTAFASATVNVNPVLNASAFYNTTVCYNNLTQLYATATGGTAPYTYQWSNPGSISDPASASPFVFPSVPTVYDVTITDVQGCQASASVQVDVVATASANIYPVNPEICAGDIIRLTATGGTTYQWSSIPAGFNSTQASPFVYPLVTTQYIVKVTSACGIAYDTTTVTVHPLPVVTFAPLAGVCVSASPFVLTGGSPAGGIYSGPGVSSGMFIPAIAGAGLKTLTYTYTDLLGCTNSATQTIMVNPLPVVSFSGLAATYCVNNAPVILTGSPSGGTFSGSGISGNIFDPALAGAGIHIITYTYTDGNGCTNASTQNVTVYELPVISIINLPTTICITDLPVNIVGSAAPGGSFSGPGITNLGSGVALFNPIPAGLGTKTITYTYTDVNGCTNSVSQNITVHPAPNVTFSGLALSYCGNAAPVTLTGNQAPFGTFTGHGITDLGNGTAIFDPAVALTYFAFLNKHEIRYTYTSPAGCTNYYSLFVTVHPVPTINAGPDQTICLGNVAQLNAIPGGGTPPYSYAWNNGASLSNPAIRNPIASPIVTTTYTITISDANGCQNTDDITITVNDPVATVTDDTTCLGTAIMLQVIPSGGSAPYTYIWSPVAGLDNPFIQNPMANPATVGVHVYSVTITDAIGCSGSASLNLTVLPIPLAFNVTGGGSYCAPGAGIAVGLDNSETGVDYELYLDGLATGQIVSGTGSPISFGLQQTGGLYTVVGTLLSSGCPLEMNGSATVIAYPTPIGSATPPVQTVCSDVAITTIVLGTTNNVTGTTFAWTRDNTANATGIPASGSGNISGIFNNVTGIVQTVTFTVIPTSPDGCVGAPFTAVVNVRPEPLGIATPANQTVCSDVLITTIVLSTSNNLAGTTYAWTRDNNVDVTGMAANGT